MHAQAAKAGRMLSWSLPEKKLHRFYVSLPETERDFPALFEDTLMADNVPALLKESYDPEV